MYVEFSVIVDKSSDPYDNHQNIGTHIMHQSVIMPIYDIFFP